MERDTEVRLLVLAALSGEHVLFIGPPGTAKSEVGRRLSALIDGTYFERLLTRFSVPEVRTRRRVGGGQCWGGAGPGQARGKRRLTQRFWLFCVAHAL